MRPANLIYENFFLFFGKTMYRIFHGFFVRYFWVGGFSRKTRFFVYLRNSLRYYNAFVVIIGCLAILDKKRGRGFLAREKSY